MMALTYFTRDRFAGDRTQALQDARC